VLSPPANAFVDTLIGLKSEDLHPMGIGLMMAKMLAQRKEDQRMVSKMRKPNIDKGPKSKRNQHTHQPKLKL
jgi:hypothetical protein